MKALSYYEVSELAEMGISAMWVGFEAERAGYAKMKGKMSYQELADECRKYGIGLIASMIIGFDYQTPEIIRQELAQLIRLKPAAPQFLIYGPSGGTPLLKRMKAEGRLNKDYDDTRLREGFSLMFEHPHLTAPQMRALLMECYDSEYQANGPTIYRGIENSLIAYKHLRDSSVPRLKARADQLRKGLVFSWGARRVGLAHAPNERVRKTIEDLYADVARVVGPPSLAIQALDYAALAAAEWTKFRLRHERLGNPQTKVHTYNWENYSAAAPRRVEVAGFDVPLPRLPFKWRSRAGAVG
jgi:hypothetical protein